MAQSIASRPNEIRSNADDDGPMVYTTTRDYKTWAQQERARLLAEGASPESVLLQSEVRNHVPVIENESGGDYVKRYCETMNAMIRRGVKILNDQCVADRAPDEFGTQAGKRFNLGPNSGATKGEYREFVEWWNEVSSSEQINEVPEKFKRFEKQTEEQEVVDG